MAFRLTLAGLVWVVAGCGGAPAQPASTAPTPPAPAPATPAPTPAPFEWPALIASTPAADAPAQLAQFGRLVGVWTCTSEQRGADGTFKPGKDAATWTWFYTLGGYAVQDLWEPAKGAAGTNLRVYDADKDVWDIQWTTASLSHFEHITARAVDDTIVMHGEVAAGAFPAHARQITFFAITDASFEWKYEATKPGGMDNWTEQSRLHCRKTAADPTVR